MKAVLSRYTKSDLLAGIAWFDNIAVGLGDRFETEFYAALERVRENPDLFAPDHTEYRPCRLKRFTAVLYFRLDRDLLVVVGLFTSGQDETVLRSRA